LVTTVIGENDVVFWSAVRSAIAVVVVTFGLVGADAVLAQGRLDARYTVTLAGIPIGKGAWVIDIAETRFTSAVSGSTAGLFSIFSGGQGTAASRGGMVDGRPVPASFSSSITRNQKSTEDIRMTLRSGDVKDYEITPTPPPSGPERVPMTDAHRRGVNDPMTATLVRVPGNGNPVEPKACERTASVFDGRMRFNLLFAYKRIEQVKADKGYEGPTVVCAIYFVPIAGYIPTRATIKYLASQRDMEVWLAPVGASRVLVPFRMSVPTPIGLGVLRATQFVSSPPPRAAAAAVPRVQ
jgi:hypothetical protein